MEYWQYFTIHTNKYTVPGNKYKVGIVVLMVCLIQDITKYE